MKLSKFLIAFVLNCVFLNLYAYNFSGFEFIDGGYYRFDKSEKVAMLTHATYNFGGYSGDFKIPSTVEFEGQEYKVVRIEHKCFYQCGNLTSLSIPSTVTYIEDDSNNETFAGCNKLTTLIIEDGTTTLTFGTNLKYLPNLENVYVGRYVRITYSGGSEGSPFEFAAKLKEVTIGSKVKQLPRNFLRSTEIASITIPESVTTIGSDAFSSCKKLTKLVLPSSVKTIGDICSYSGIKELYIGDNVQIIPEGAFTNNTDLSIVMLGSGITEIGKAAFKQCDQLRNIYIFSNNLSSIGTNCFPEKIGKIFVPNPSKYSVLLKDYFLENLLTIKSYTSEYNGKLPDLTFTNNTPITNVSIELNSDACNVGQYNEPVSVVFSVDSWTTRTSINADYTITPAPLFVFADNAYKKYGEENPTLNCSIIGFKNDETEDVLTKYPVLSTNATTTSPAGTYPIIVSGGEAQNYSFNYERGTLTITKADQNIEWDQKFDSVSVGDIIELTATSSSELPIQYRSSDENIAIIFTDNQKKYVEFLESGRVSIEASQKGNDNYDAAESVIKSVKINSGTVDEIYSVNYSVSEIGSMTTEVKAGNSVTVNISGSEDWNVKNVYFNNQPVEYTGTTYVSPEITENSSIRVEYEYAHEIIYDYTTGVEAPEEWPYKVAFDNGHVIISGVHEGDQIMVYTVGGLLIKALPEVPTGKETVTISLEQGEVYIIVINGTPLKVAY